MSHIRFETRNRHERDHRFDFVKHVLDEMLAGVQRGTLKVTIDQIRQAVKTAHGQTLGSHLVKDAVDFWSKAGRYSIPHVSGDGNVFEIKQYKGTRGVLPYEIEGGAL